MLPEGDSASCRNRSNRPPARRTARGCSAPYAGHSTAAASNALYRGNLAKGQTGLSVAFDPADADGLRQRHELKAEARSARSACRSRILGDMRMLFVRHSPRDDEHLDDESNATAPWLLALYVAVAEEQGADTKKLQGTVQNDIIKEYLLARAPISARPSPACA